MEIREAGFGFNFAAVVVEGDDSAAGPVGDVVVTDTAATCDVIPGSILASTGPASFAALRYHGLFSASATLRIFQPLLFMVG